MAFNVDLGTDVGKMRVLIPDRNDAAYVFEDEELMALLQMEGGNVKKGAALALEVIATNEAMVLKVIRLLDLSTDGAKTADALMKRASTLRAQAKTEAGDDVPSFDIAEMVIDGWQYEEFTVNNALRGG